VANSKEIVRRIKSVKNTAKITKAMELISIVKMKKSQNLALEKKPFVEEILKVFLRIQGFLKDFPFFSTWKWEKTLWIIVTSNKWLCWGYNINIMKRINKYIKETDEKLDFIAVWKRWAQFVARTWNTLIADFSHDFSDNIIPYFSNQISRLVIEKFLYWDYKKVVIFYNHYVNTIKQIPVAREFLPLNSEYITKYLLDVLWDDFDLSTDIKIVYDIEPSTEEVAMRVVPMILDMMFYDILLEAKASEHSSRMIAMKNAKDNANKYASKLTLEYNKTRQAAITKEVSEIVSWVESIKE